ncbi:MAG TPA: polysaccharide biosynthesis/export family protein [bacterium]|nr:polysaccharide biosynthesis/export family protein [bacterium]HQI47822.1 polysaccharide biosynthesis/export family protein [bacterium]HQJ64014.1 polysaccharide biosynthesis/export family protein [bacterium]
MKGNRIRRWLAASLALLFTVVTSSCSVRPHAGGSSVEGSKVIVAAAPVKENRVEKIKEQKRSKVVQADKKKAQAKQQTARKETAQNKAPAAQTQLAAQAEAVSPNQVVIEPRVASVQAPVLPMVYRLGFGDVLDVKFLASPEYNETVTIRPDGRISLQGVGELDALGLSPAALDSVITVAYSQILVNPDVTVIVRNFGGQKCYVAGEVEHPGSLDIAKDMTLLRAIAAAGGPKKSAKLGSVILIRMDARQRIEATRLDLSYTSLKGGIENDLPVVGNDIIFVPRTFIADINAVVSQIYDILLPPFDSWTRYYYWYRGLR